MNLSVIIPVYNEAKTIAEIVRRVQKTGLVYETVIVDDGSSDGTREYLKTLEGQPGFQVIYHDRNRGKGAAVVTGMRAATGQVMII
jgi:glycosyltransferase involved in cell wall biosynthesis